MNVDCLLEGLLNSFGILIGVGVVVVKKAFFISDELEFETNKRISVMSILELDLYLHLNCKFRYFKERIPTILTAYGQASSFQSFEGSQEANARNLCISYESICLSQFLEEILDMEETKLKMVSFGLKIYF
uniref:Uncharacterized protein n=1 Tax=Glossina austeni TaxID=7395 RepID=A0A1A9UF28_GLOAU